MLTRQFSLGLVTPAIQGHSTEGDVQQWRGVDLAFLPSWAPEMKNVSIFSGGSSIDIYSDVSEAYVIGKVLEEKLGVTKKASSYDEASWSSKENAR